MIAGLAAAWRSRRSPPCPTRTRTPALPPSIAARLRSSAMRVGFCVRRVLEALVLAELFLHVGRGLVDRRDDGAGRRIGFLAGVQADGAESRVGCELHDPATIHVLISRSPWPTTSPPPAADRRAGVRGALLHTLPGRAIVIGLAVKLAVFARRLAARRACRRFSRVVDTVAGARGRGRRRVLRRPADRAREAPPAVARPPQADPLVHLHRLRPGAAARRVLRCCAASCCSTTSARTWCRAGCARSSDQARLPRAEHGARDSARRRPRRRRHHRAPAGERGASEYPGRLDRRRADRTAPCDGSRDSSAELASAGLARRSTRRPVGARRSAATRARRGSTAPASPACSALLAPPQPPDGAADADTHLLVRARRVSRCAAPGYAVVVDLLVNDAIRAAAAQRDRRRAEERDARSADAATRRASRWPAATAATTRPPAAGADRGLLSSLPSLIEYRDWATGATGTLTVVDAAERRASSTTGSRRRRAASARTLRPGAAARAVRRSAGCS